MQPPPNSVQPQFQQPMQQLYQPPPIHPQPPPAYQQHSLAVPHVDPLHQDIENLIVTTKRDFASAPFDIATQERLRALLALQDVLKTTAVSPENMQQIRNQVAQLSLPRTTVTMPTAPPAPTPYTAPPPLQQAPQPSNDLQALLSSNTLADILSKAAKAEQPPPPTHSQAPLQQPHLPLAQSYTTQTPAPPTGGSSLIESLRAAGILPTQPTPPVNGSAYSQPSLTFPPLSHMPSTPPTIPSRPGVPQLQNDVELTSTSLKM